MNQTAKDEITIYDATLREGEQHEGVSFTPQDKIEIATILSQLGVSYIELGYPGSNPSDKEAFSLAMKNDFGKSKIAAFGSTRKAGILPENDEGLKAILESGAKVATIFGKSELFQVEKVLQTTPEENLRMIYDSVHFLKNSGIDTVIFDAEHFMTGFFGEKSNGLKGNPAFAISTLEAALNAGADEIVLCDTRGSLAPFETEKVVRAVAKKFPGTVVGYHGHNDCGCAAANSLSAVQAGARHVQVTVNGWGERSGNANMFTVAPKLLFSGWQIKGMKSLEHLAEYAQKISQIANVPFDDNQPYVGATAFTHKGGTHVYAVDKDPRTYEHVPPELVGNARNFEVPSGISGTATMEVLLEKYGISRKSTSARAVLEKLKDNEHEGYRYESALASLELLALDVLGMRRKPFSITSWESGGSSRNGKSTSTASIKVSLFGAEMMSSSESSKGQVDALTDALRKSVSVHYPLVDRLKLLNYRELAVTPAEGTGSKVRVLTEWTDGKNKWSTVGIAYDQTLAGLSAISEAIEYGLLLHSKAFKPIPST
jgi:2-isopropylmalate synthase